MDDKTGDAGVEERCDRLAGGHAKAEAVFGGWAFRSRQRELIEAVLSGRDALGILPKGEGKSLVFQLASLSLEKPVVVVSPFVSLSEDQTDKLELRMVLALHVFVCGITAHRQGPKHALRQTCIRGSNCPAVSRCAGSRGRGRAERQDALKARALLSP